MDPIIVVAVIAFFVFDLGRFLSLHELKSRQDLLQAYAAAQPLISAGIFFAIYTLVTALSFPGAGTASKAPQVKAYFGVGTYAAGFTTLLDTRGQFATQKSFLLTVTLQNRNSMSSNQIRPNDYTIGASMNAFAAVAIDFTQDVTIAFGALNNSTSVSADDQQVLDWFSIEMLA